MQKISKNNKICHCEEAAGRRGNPTRSVISRTKGPLQSPALFRDDKRGFSTIELLIAMTIVVLALSAVILVSFGNQSLATDSQTAAEAQHKAQELIEMEQANARFDFNLVNPLPVPPATFIQDDIYKKKVDVTNPLDPITHLPDYFTKKVTATIIWTGDHNRTENVSLSTLVTDPSATGGGSACSSVLSGDWTNPQKREYEFGSEILKDTSSGFPITSIQAFDHRLYVTVDNDNGNNPGTFFILDISNPAQKPVLLTPPLWDNSPVGRGLNAVAVDGGKYAYVANAYGAPFSTCAQGVSCNQMQVIDIGVMPPAVVKNFKVPGVTGTGGQGVGKSILYKEGIVYLGLTKNPGPEFIIIDVGGGGTPGASPTDPKILSSLEIGSAVNALFVKNGYAYVASPDDQELKIYDVHIPSSPRLAGGFDAPNGGGNNGNGKSIYLIGSTLYFGRTLLNGNEFYILNDSNPEANLPVLGFKDIRNSGNNTSVNGILVRDFLAFLITNEEFQILRVDNPTNISQYANPLTLPPGTGGGLQGTATDCEGNYIYVGSQSSNDKGYISVITGGP